jgi:glycosyltransferase involved in cell wall biosynthesis
MPTPFFSVVTISYNQAPFLDQAISSVLSQSYRNFEYIVQDPGSTDGSQDLIASYGHALSFSFVDDAGPADGLNQAFLKANGDYYLFLNSDDRLLPGALDYFYNWISRDKFNHDIYSGGARIIDSSGSILRKTYSDKMSLRRAAYGHSILIQPSTVFSAASFKAVNGFNKANKTNWDGELFIDMALKGFRFKITSHLLSDYRIHQKSITGSGALKQSHDQYSLDMFEKITKSSYTKRSDLVSLLYSLERKILNPLDTYERIRGGPIFRSA